MPRRARVGGKLARHARITRIGCAPSHSMAKPGGSADSMTRRCTGLAVAKFLPVPANRRILADGTANLAHNPALISRSAKLSPARICGRRARLPLGTQNRPQAGVPGQSARVTTNQKSDSAGIGSRLRAEPRQPVRMGLDPCIGPNDLVGDLAPLPDGPLPSAQGGGERRRREVHAAVADGLRAARRWVRRARAWPPAPLRLRGRGRGSGNGSVERSGA